MDCLLSVTVIFQSLLPSVNSNMFLLDDHGLMVGSTVNGTVSVASILLTMNFICIDFTKRYHEIQQLLKQC